MHWTKHAFIITGFCVIVLLSLRSSSPGGQIGNMPPVFPVPFRASNKTEFAYDKVGRLKGAVTTITIISAASDPDGDPLIYTWSASNGSINGSGLTATWNRGITFGEPEKGTVTVTVSDGKGGSVSWAFKFE